MLITVSEYFESKWKNPTLDGNISAIKIKDTGIMPMLIENSPIETDVTGIQFKWTIE